MARGFIPIQRVIDGAGHEEICSGQLSPWMQALVDRQPNAVDEARKRQQRASVITEVNTIMANPPRYATVDDAVKDMRERTGLNQYLSAKQADNKKKRQDNGTLTRESASKIVSIVQPETEVPEALAKYQGALDGIINYVRNTVRNSRGLGVSVPQLVYDVQSIFGPQYGILSQDMNSPEVIEFLSDLLSEEKDKYGPPPEENVSTIGLDIGTADKGDQDDNQDYFGFAQPVTQ